MHTFINILVYPLQVKDEFEKIVREQFDDPEKFYYNGEYSGLATSLNFVQKEVRFNIGVY